MGKIPVGRTVGEALGFSFGRYFSNLGVVWLPLVLFGTCYYFAFVPLFAEIAAAARDASHHAQNFGSSSPFLHFNRMVPVVALLGLLIRAWIGVGITKVVFGLPKKFSFAYVSIGIDELRVIGANIVVLAFFYGAVFAVVVVGLIVAAVIGALVAGGAFSFSHAGAPGPWGICAAIAAGLAVVAVVVYFAARLIFFLVPVTVAERRFGLWRSWELSKGNVWRIVGVVFLIFLLLFGLELALFTVVGIPAMFVVGSLWSKHQPGDPGAVLAMLHPFFLALAALFLLIAPILYGIVTAPSAFAYRALVPEPVKAE